MADINVIHKSEAQLKIIADKYILKEIERHFRYKNPDYYRKVNMNPKMAYKITEYFKMFDGRNNTIPYGLINDLVEFCRDNNYSLDIPRSISCQVDNYSDEDVSKIISDMNLPFQPYDYQVRAFKHVINKHRVTLISPTSSGKSLIAYLITSYLVKQTTKNRILIFVPNKGLVKQLVSDFKDYGSDQQIYTIEGGVDKTIPVNTQIVISTWQSIYKESEKYLSQFTAIIGDEFHGLNASSVAIRSLSNKCINAKYRIGMTGTLRPEKFNIKYVEGATGPVFTVTTTKKEQDNGRISKVNIQAIKIQYPDNVTEQLNRLDWQSQLDFYENTSNPRQRLIIDMANKLNGVTLILFRKIEHGNYLFDEMLKSSIKEHVYFIDGSVSGTDRLNYSKQVEHIEDDAVIVASYGVFSTGINIKRLRTVIFASSAGKSSVRVLQSIGRALRLHAEKTKHGARVIDFVDCIKYPEKHFNERKQIYKKEQFPFKITHLDLKEYMEKHYGDV